MLCPSLRNAFLCTVSVVAVCAMGPVHADPPPESQPVTLETVHQLALLTTIEDYRDTSDFCTCDVRLFSTNGRTLATDWKVHDLMTGMTLDLRGRGYPLAINPDGTQVLVSGDHSGTRLLDVQTGREQTLMPDDADDGVFSPDGSLVATTSRDADAIQVWRVAGPELLTTLGRSRLYVTTDNLAFTADGRYLLWVDRKDSLSVWNVAKQAPEWQVARNIWDYHLSADQRTVVLQKQDFGTVEAWDLDSHKLLTRMEDTQEFSGVDTYALSPDRQTLVVSYYGSNQRLELWDIASQVKTPVELDERYGFNLLFTPDSRFLMVAGGSQDQGCDRESGSCSGGGSGWTETIQIVDVGTAQVIDRAVPADGHSISHSLLMAGGTLLVTSDSYGHAAIDLWQVEGSTLTRVQQLPGGDVQISPDGSTFLATIDNDFLAVYGIPSAARPVQQYVLPGKIIPSSVSVRAEPNGDAAVVGTASGAVRVLGLSPAGDYVYLPDAEGWIRSDPLYLQLALDMPVTALQILDPAAVVALAMEPTDVPVPTPTQVPTAVPAVALDQLQLPIGEPVLPPVMPPDGLQPITPEQVEAVTLLAVLPATTIRNQGFPLLVPSVSLDGSHLISPPIQDQHTPFVWDLRTFEAQPGPEIDTSYAYGMAVVASPDGQHIVFTPDEYEVPLKLWSSERGWSMNLFTFITGSYSALAFRPDGQDLAVPGGVFDVQTGRLRFTLDTVGAAVYSPDSARLALMSRERGYFYDASSGELLAQTPRVEPHTDLVDGRFSPDHTTFLATTYDGIQVYDGETGTLRYTKTTGSYSENWEIEQVIFSPDATWIAALDPQGILQIWDAHDGTAEAVLDTDGGKGIAFSPDGQLLAISHPLRLIELRSGVVTPVSGDYGGSHLLFSPDGSSLLIESADRSYDDLQSVTVLGIPTAERPGDTPGACGKRFAARLQSYRVNDWLG